MSIDTAYKFCLYCINKNQAGSFTGAQFNLLAPTAQLELISNLLGNEELLNNRGVPPYGYKSNRKIDTLLRPLVVTPETITVAGDGTWAYPEGFIWPDVVHKTNFYPIKIVDSDEYPDVKTSVIHPPTTDYPVIILNYPLGFCDPITLGTFKMGYLKMPVDPYWAFSVVNDVEVYSPSGSVDFALHPMAHLRICMKILQSVGVNLDMAGLVTAYAQLKEKGGI